MVKIDSEGYIFVGCGVGVALLFWVGYFYSHWYGVFLCSWVALLFSFFSLYFFRDPERKGPEEQQVAVSAADGVVMDISTIQSHEFEDGRALRIAVFMNVFNVHVNRSPLDGRVMNTEHRLGKKLCAFTTRAEDENEQSDIDIETHYGFIRVRQIAGILARRIVTRVKKGDSVKRGERLGIIRFGSRVDVFLPLGFTPLVKKGEHVYAGKTAVASCPSLK